MPVSSFNLRNIAPNVLLSLKKEAAKQKISINSLILQIIEQRLGIVCVKKHMIYHDLDYLAGTWNDKDKKSFDENIKSFENIDQELWS
jgi:hypothetical protein